MFVFSNCLTELFDTLCHELEQVPLDSLVKATIVVPHESIRSYVQYQLARRNISLLRLRLDVVHGCFSVEGSVWTILLTQFFDEHKDVVPGLQDTYAAAKLWRVPFVARFMTGNSNHEDEKGQKIWELFLKWCSQKIERTKLHLEGAVFAFGFSSLSPALLSQLLEAKVQRFFVLSPCMLFWADQSSDVEAYRLLGKFRELRTSGEVFKGIEELILDRQELLANCGILGREFQSLLVEMGGDIENRYVLNENLQCSPYTDCLFMDVQTKKGPASLLDHLRADMLLLSGTKGDRREVPCDNSIEIHGAPTPLHEVYALRKKVEAMGPLGPASVIVLCTQLPKYRSCIETVFGGDVSYQIWGEPTNGGAIATFASLVQVCTSSSTSFDWKQIVRQTVVQRALGLDNERTLEVLNYLTSIPSVWGLSNAYQERYCTNRCLPLGGDIDKSFEAEKRSLIDAFISPSSLHEERRSLEAISSVAIFLSALEKLTAAAPLPLDESSLYAMSELLPLFKTVFEVFCADDGAEERALMSAITTLSRIVLEIGDPKLPFQEVKNIFFSTVQSELVKKGHRIQAPIIVAEFGAFQAFPASLIAILGADEEYLPKSDDDTLLERLHLVVGKASSSNIFLEKYHFIETLLCAEILFIGYQEYSFETKEQLLPSCMVVSLLQHLEALYSLDGKNVSGKICFSASLEDRMCDEREGCSASQDLLLPEKQRSSVVDIRALFRCSRAPLQRYYEERFALHAIFADKESIFTPNYVVQRHMASSLGRKIGKLSKGVQQEIAHETQKLHTCLTYLGIASLSLIDVHLLPFLEEMSCDIEAKKYVVPSVCLTDLLLHGTLEGYALEGIVLTSENWHKELFGRWCEHVFRSHMALHRGIPFESAAIVVFEQQKIPLPLDSRLELFMNLYKEAQQRPFPFTYEIVSLLVQEASVDEVYNAIVEQGASFQMPHPWNVFASSVTLQEISSLYPVWKQVAKELYGNFFLIQERA